VCYSSDKSDCAHSKWGSSRRIATSLPRARVRRGVRCLMTMARTLPCRLGLLVLLLTAVPAIARAAVTLVSFEAAPEGGTIRLTWETGSELHMLGFYIQRAPHTSQEDNCHSIPGLVRISDIILAEFDIDGGLYEYVDTSVEEEEVYTYCLEAREIGQAFELHGPISASLSQPMATPTATPPTPTPTRTPSSGGPPGPDPTSTPGQPVIQFWVDQDRISRGACTALHWRTENAQEVRFEGQSVAGDGDRQVCPQQTTVYELRVVTGAGEENREVTVLVQDGTLPTSTATPRPSAPVPTPSPSQPTPVSTPSAPAATPSPRPSSGADPTGAPLFSPTLSPTRALAASPSSPMTASPTPTPAPVATPRLEDGEGSALPCGLLLALVGGGIGLILLGVWGFWRTRESV
jgi:hypothetical protein